MKPTLKDVIKMIERLGGHFKGKGDGTIFWESDVYEIVEKGRYI